MTTHLSQQSLSVDPVIAEANGRAKQRRRRFIRALVLILAGGSATAVGFLSYMHSRNSALPVEPVRVLVAQWLIPKGTTGSTLLSARHYSIMEIPSNQVEHGAFTSPTSLGGKVAAVTISPGQQLTASDFGHSTH